MQATAAVQQQEPLRVSLTLATLATPGSSINQLGQWAVKAAQDAGLQFNVNLMVMDYGSTASCQVGSDGNCDMAASAIFAAKEFSKDYNIPLSRIELTPMIGDNDTANETTTVDNLTKIVSDAKQNGMAGVHFWSFDRDTPCNKGAGYGASPTCNSSSSKALDYDRVLIGDASK